jgi:hypothetical protein
MHVLSQTTFKVGNRVRFRLGAHNVLGRIVEDRGNIGVNGRRLFRVEVQLDPTYVQVFELPIDALKPAAQLVHGGRSSRIHAR